LVLDVFPWSEKSNQGHYVAVILPEFSMANPTAEPRVGKNPLVAHTYENAHTVQQYFARKPMTRVRYPVHSVNLSPSDFWFFCCPEEQMKDQLSVAPLQPVFLKWTASGKWVTGKKGEWYLNPRALRRNCICSSWE
jgi:hypothetical protein